MRNLLKFDFYKAIKSISTRIILLCVIGFSIASLTITYVSKNGGGLSDVALEIGEQATVVSLEEMTIVDWCVDSISGDFLMLFVIVFAILFTCNDYATGFIKNVYNTIKHKWHYVLSEFVVISLFAVLTILAAYIVTLIFNFAVIKSSSLGDVSELLVFTLNKALLLIACGCVGALISFVFKKATASLIICMGYSFMFASLIYTGVNQIVKNAGISDAFDVQKYTLVGNTISLNANISFEQQRIVLLVGCIAIVGSFMASSILFAKRDI